jgi:iron complex outermembrane receptor protein
MAAALSLLTGGGAVFAATGEVSERQYFEELPVVLSVSRLAQPLDETPGAVTVIDRDMIRKSGVREMTELLRMVPGFVVGGFNGANQLAAYHVPFDEDLGRHVQIMVDGRSVYSSFHFGDTHRGLAGVVLEDIERIEVLRGSNSAAYGANAFLGVINVVTRNAFDSRGAMVSMTAGEGGIDDHVVRVGAGSDRAAFRATVARRADSGLDKVYDDKRIEQFHVRTDLRPSGQDELTVSAGRFVDSYGDGIPGDVGNLPRTTKFNSGYLQGAWRRDLAANQSLRLAATYDSEQSRNAFPYLPLPGLTIDAGGSSQRFSLQGQHTVTFDPRLRAVWGGEYRHELVRSPQLYFLDADLTNHLWRWFGNVEWRPFDRLVVNAGGLWENHSIVGSRFSPRLMANLHVFGGQTLRAGITEAHRVPTLFELRGDTRYYHPLIPLAFGVPYVQTVKASGKVEPEAILVREVGYLGEFPAARLTIDVRAFDESIDKLVVTQGTPNDYVNQQGPKIFGWEHETTWRPLPGSRIMLGQHFQRVDSFDAKQQHYAPTQKTSLAWFQDIPGDWSASVRYVSTGSMSWRVDRRLKSEHQLNLRLAKSFRIGPTRGELAWSVEQANGPRQEFLPTYTRDRRAYATLRLEY